MKGVVFDILRDMVEEKFGLEGWNILLEKAGLDGLFLSSESYPDKDMVALVTAAMDYTGKSQEELLREFGIYMVGEFYQRFPSFFENCTTLFEFLLSVDQIVHGEVLKLYPDANLPSFTYRNDVPDKLTMVYRSSRKFCYLAEGLIQGSANHYGTGISITHDVCMHTGADACEIMITLDEGADG